MAHHRIAPVFAVLALGLAGAAWAAPVPANIQAALADKGRPAVEVSRDAARKPGELLAFSGKVKPGAHVADLIIGGGYFTRVLAVAVGPKGGVVAYQPAEFIAYRAAYADELKAVAGAHANITPLTTSLGGLELPAGLDLVMTVQNYHDLHLKPFPADNAAKVNAAVFKALKPGGVYLVVDHAALAGAPLTTADTLHRVDEAIVKQEVEAAGFKLDAESPMLHDAADPHTASVFDPAIRGKTDQFVLKFKKPG
ncbi:MAG: methyltransferase [Phenylobacterium sp.]